MTRPMTHPDTEDLKVSVTSADIQRRFSTVRAKMAAGPVSVTIHGHPKMVIMTQEHFQALKRGSNTPPR